MTTHTGIVPIIAAKDDFDILTANISYHLNVGVKGIVVCVLPSSSGSGSYTQFADDPRVVIIHASTQNWEEFEWRKELVEIAKDEFQPCFITHIDADEFLYATDRESLSAWEMASDCNSLLRFNCISSMSKDFRFPKTMRECDPMIVIRFPFLGIEHSSAQNNDAAWLYTAVAPKVILRSEKLDHFIGGSHSAADSDGNIIDSHNSENLYLLHFPFTTFDRFLNKVRNLSEIIDQLVSGAEAGYAFHWQRWCNLLDSGGEDAVRAEYDQQVSAATDALMFKHLASATSIAPNGPSALSSKALMEVSTRE